MARKLRLEHMALPPGLLREDFDWFEIVPNTKRGPWTKQEWRHAKASLHAIAKLIAADSAKTDAENKQRFQQLTTELAEEQRRQIEFDDKHDFRISIIGYLETLAGLIAKRKAEHDAEVKPQLERLAKLRRQWEQEDIRRDNAKVRQQLARPGKPVRS